MGEFKRALKYLDRLRWGYDVLGLDVVDQARVLTQQIVAQTAGRLQKQALSLDDALQEKAKRTGETQERRQYQARQRRIELNTVAFAVLTSTDPDPEERSSAIGRLSFEVLTPRVRVWASSLHACYLAGHKPVSALGVVPMSAVEQVRALHLMRETVNEIVLEHAAFVENIADLRQAVPGCLGFAMVRDDLRVRRGMRV